MGIKLSTKQAAPIIGVSPATLESWRCRNHPHQPPYYVVGGRVIYDQDEVERFLQTCHITRRGM
jgi:hypothetical protein